MHQIVQIFQKCKYVGVRIDFFIRCRVLTVHLNLINRDCMFFWLLLMFVKLVLLLTFLCFLNKFFQRILNQHEVLCFWYLYCFFFKNIFFCRVSTFLKLWSQTRKKRLKKSKKTYFVNVSQISNFAPIKGSMFLGLKKKV